MCDNAACWYLPEGRDKPHHDHTVTCWNNEASGRVVLCDKCVDAAERIYGWCSLCGVRQWGAQHLQKRHDKDKEEDVYWEQWCTRCVPLHKIADEMDLPGDEDAQLEPHDKNGYAMEVARAWVRLSRHGDGFARTSEDGMILQVLIDEARARYTRHRHKKAKKSKTKLVVATNNKKRISQWVPEFDNDADKEKVLKRLRTEQMPEFQSASEFMLYLLEPRVSSNNTNDNV